MFSESDVNFFSFFFCLQVGCLNGFSILPSRRFLTFFFLYLVLKNNV